MFTICTQCHRQFRIRADQLNAAGGQVMCGYCGTQFNALENLSDFLSTETASDQQTTTSSSPVGSTGLAEQETVVQFDAMDDDIHTEQIDPGISTIELERPRKEKDKVLDSATAASILRGVQQHEVEREFILSDSKDDTEQESLDDLIQELTSVKHNAEDIEEPPQVLSIQSSTDAVDPEQMSLHNPYAVELLNDVESSNRLSTVLWRCLALLLLLLMVSQLAWSQRSRIMQDFPRTAAYYRQFCQFARCSLLPRTDFSKISLLTRDVRLHPAYQDSLLVNAVIINQAEFAMPYPRMQLSLFDTNGSMVSYRQFQPSEYLDKGIDLEAGMQPKTPVHFVLELAGHVQSAVSFEFDFY